MRHPYAAVTLFYGGRSMRIAIVGINYAPEPTGIPVYTTGLAEYLVNEGHDVTVYTGFPYYPRWTKTPEDRRQVFRCETINGVKVRRHYIYVPARLSTLKRMAHELSFVISSMLGYLFGPRADLTIIISPPLFTGIPVALIAWFKRSRTILHVQDLQPDAAVDLGMLKPGPLMNLFFALERLTYRLVHRVSTISDGMMAKIAAKGVSRDKMLLFRNWANDDVVSPRDSNTSFRREWGLDGKFVALYSGNMGVKQGLKGVLEAAAALQEQNDIEVVIVGDGGEKPALMKRASDMGLTNLQFRPLAPMERLAELLATADVALVPQKDGVKDIVLPSKLCNLLASGRPVVAAASLDTELGRIVSESGCGVLVEPENGLQMAEMIRHLRRATAVRDRMGRDGRRYMETFLGSGQILAEFMDQIELLVTGPAIGSSRGTLGKTPVLLGGSKGRRAPRSAAAYQSGFVGTTDDKVTQQRSRRREESVTRRYG